MPPLSARGLEDAVAALETGATVMDPADPTNMAVTAAESGRAYERQRGMGEPQVP